MDYTITINPDNWRTFLGTNPLRFAFRETMLPELKKLKIGDRFVVYLAQKVEWCGVFSIQKVPYKTREVIYPNEPSFNIVVEVGTIFLPKEANYVPIRDPKLWTLLDRFLGVNHKASGWIYKAKLARSLCRISSSDTQLILDYLILNDSERK